MRQILLTTWVAIVAAGCKFDGDGESAGATDSAAGDTDATAGEATDSTMSPAVTAGDSEAGETTEMGASYCHGFQAVAEAPFLSLYVLGGELLQEGALWPLECGSEGRWMFGLYPSLGGWDPMSSEVTFAVEVDVDGFDLGPDGHFFRDEVDYHIGCEEPLAGPLGVAPVVPPESVTDLSQLDGTPAHVRVTVLAGEEELRVEADVTLSAPSDLVLLGCMSV